MASPDASHKGDILVVDDRADNLRLLAKMLSEQGYKVRKVIKAELVYDVVQVNPPDLILLDIFMPTLSGFEVCQQLKADDRTQSIPIIFLSASDEPLDKVKAFSIGGEDYITKPFEIREVLARIEHQLRIVRLQQQMREQNQQLQAEVAERLKAQAALQQVNNELEERVRDRTLELTHTNQQLQLLGQQLQQSLAQEQELNRLKSRIITTISHEYRTPMAIISSSTGILEDYFDQLTEELRRKHLGRIQGAIQRILALINDVILLNRLEFEPVDVHPTPVHLQPLIEATIAEITSSQAIAPTITLDIPTTCAPPSTDINLLSSIVTSLLSNAVKFSRSPATIAIAVTCTPQQISLTVQDQGIGIPEDELADIFDPFFRASNANNIQGVGMGLAIVQRCVDLLKGRIEVSSQCAIGTTVTVTLPNLGSNAQPHPHVA